MSAFPQFRFDRAFLSDFEAASRAEWIETNGLGGYAMQAVHGGLTRCYHGLLIAAGRPPVGRVLTVAALAETLLLDGISFELGCQRRASGIDPQGHRLLASFERHPFPRHVWAAGGARLERRLVLLHDRNTLLVRYRLLEAPGPVTLSVRPLCALRNHHDGAPRLVKGRPLSVARAGRAVVVSRADTGLSVRLLPGEGEWEDEPGWFTGVVQDREVERGLDAREDLFQAGRIGWTVAPGGSADLVITTEEATEEGSCDVLEAGELRRRTALIRPVEREPAWVRALFLAADQFLVRRGAAGRSVIAGYPWFTDWGRDTLISLPGLCFATGHVEEGGSILSTLAAHCRDGLIPNHFPDQGDEPLYNTIDASLWFFPAIRAYLESGGAAERVREDLFPVAADILARYESGTRFGIRADPAGFITWSAPTLALTWMDARVDDWAATPRQGRPVEIQALWHAALREMAALCRRFDRPAEAGRFEAKAARVADAFRRAFWNEAAGTLFDVLSDEGPDPSVRPNALFAVSLGHDLLEPDRARRVVDTARRLLYTPWGLRSLSPRDPAYIGVYKGGRRERDAAYHQGTVWGWLLGPYGEAALRTAADPAEGRREVLGILERAVGHLGVDGVGTFAEIFDGDPPHTPRGCPAQAWSVAELIRLWTLVRGGEKG